MKGITELLLNAPTGNIADSIAKADYQIKTHSRILCSISGGWDSTIMMDLLTKLDTEGKITYVWYDTGLVYKAEKEHLDYLENRYGVKIVRKKAYEPIPLAVKRHGYPFLNKRASEYIMRLQMHSFDFTSDDSIEVLRERYCKRAEGDDLKTCVNYMKEYGKPPKGWAYRDGYFYNGCVSALEWWCNCSKDCGENSQCNINHNKWLKEFLMENPPEFKISALCCKYAKKMAAYEILKEGDYDLNIIGIRKGEGGVRAQIQSCYTETGSGPDIYRPIFWYSEEDKIEYTKYYDIHLSDCYIKWNLPRTGCCLCPYALPSNFAKEEEAVAKHDPQLYKAVKNVFAPSYEYTNRYREFVKKKDKEVFYEKYGFTQITLEDLIA
ncbi:MAG: phosphoadenosine phosphosulfate reductase [Pseudobutyrivibrio ruminis]|uniref:Phosphoadenosine phosphosulfate reductase n=1 Tax=Pseudobutyrivibrio ruminis TaxID=46206 RepID=A0A927YN25_9FIRM|nr:phosphoadenosine phosphosulfate reductase [Pseudobutyrivibrio ruminis]